MEMKHRFHKFAMIACAAATSAAEPIASTNPSQAAPVNTVLSWPATVGAEGYDVFFGPDGAASLQCRVTEPRFVLETLAPGRTYEWFVEPVSSEAGTRSAVHRFTTTTEVSQNEAFAWPIRIANSVRALYPTPANLRQWNYTEGMVMDGLWTIAERTNRSGDFAFVQAWLDRFVHADGGIDPEAYPFRLFSLDRVRPGPVLLWVHRRTSEEKYLMAARTLARQLDEQPRTSDGGYWHRSTYPNQMWLDGIYMADVFSAQFAAYTGQSHYADEAVHQIKLMHAHTFDPRTGLYFHGWDETRTRPWADRTTGASPELWGRAIGWYAMAMADVFDALPPDHPGRKEVVALARPLCESLLRFQDRNTAMWWQIIDKPKAPGNYVETSCSLMFAYAMARGAQRGWLPPEFLAHSRRAARGILNHKVDLLPGDLMDIRDTVQVGTLGGNGGFYDTYVSVPVRTNDQKAIGAFMYLSLALSESALAEGSSRRTQP